MFEIFQYDFMIRAFIAGAVIGIIAPTIGSFLVARQYSLIADSLAHVSLVGVALGLILGIYPVYTALVVCVVVALVIERLRVDNKITGDTALAVFLSGGLAVALVLLGIGKGVNVDLFSYLFGSITTVTTNDVYLIVPLGIIVLVIIALLYKELFYVSFDEEVAKVSGIKTSFVNSVLVVITAVTVALSMRIVGVLLIGALMVIPVVSAMQIAKSFKQSIVFSIIFGFLAVILGLISSYYLNLPAGGAIVLVSLIFLGIASL